MDTISKIHKIVFDSDGKMNLLNERSYRPMRINIGRQIERNVEVDGAEDLNDAVLEPVRESLRAIRRQAAYEEVLDELDDNTDNSNLDESIQ